MIKQLSPIFVLSFVGYPLWNAVVDANGDVLVRVGANVCLLCGTADVQRQVGGGEYPFGERQDSPAARRLTQHASDDGTRASQWHTARRDLRTATWVAASVPPEDGTTNGFSSPLG